MLFISFWSQFVSTSFVFLPYLSVSVLGQLFQHFTEETHKNEIIIDTNIIYIFFKSKIKICYAKSLHEAIEHSHSFLHNWILLRNEKSKWKPKRHRKMIRVSDVCGVGEWSEVWSEKKWSGNVRYYVRHMIRSLNVQKNQYIDVAQQ